MKSTKQPEVSIKQYKALLISAREMRGEAGLKAYDRAIILCKVFDDREFRADHQNFDDFKAAELLDVYCDDLALKFLELRTLLQSRPERDQWKDGKLATMYDEVYIEIQGRETEEAKSGITRRRATLADLEEANKERDILKAENAELKIRVKVLESDLQKSRESMARLEGRLECLENGHRPLQPLS